MISVGRRRVWSLVGGLLAVSCLLPKAELVEDDSSVARATGGRSGTGGQGSASGDCNWNSGRCDEKSCAKSCPDTSQDGGHCLGACTALVDCVKRNPGCYTVADPVCGARNALGQKSLCTDNWETSGGDPDSGPSGVAREFIQCLCEK